MKVLSWNIRGISGLPEERLDGVVARVGASGADLVLLQEVGHGGGQPDKLKAALAAHGLNNFFHAPPTKAALREVGGTLTFGHYASAVASRWPLKGCEDHAWFDEKWPDLFARCEVDAGGRAVTVISAHVPNGSSYGWEKIAHLEALARGIKAVGDAPLILGGDFNEPRIERPGGRFVTWGEEPGDDGELAVWTRWRKNGREDKGARWDAAVRAVLSDENVGGLRDACRSVRGAAHAEATHVVRGGHERFFDHILVSRHLTPREMGFEHAWRTEGWSDHSAVWAEVDWTDGGTG